MVSYLISNLIILVLNYKTVHYFPVIMCLFKVKRKRLSPPPTNGVTLRPHHFPDYLQHRSAPLLDVLVALTSLFLSDFWATPGGALVYSWLYAQGFALGRDQRTICSAKDQKHGW